MGQNIGYLTAERNRESDEHYTPDYAVWPTIDFLRQKNYQTIWCPFDDNDSQFVKIFKFNNFDVINTHIKFGQDFLTMKPPEQYDVIVSNPPYSIKDQIIAKCYELNKPFMLLMPLPALQGKFRFQYFSKGLELLIFDGRISYMSTTTLNTKSNNNSFASVYFCRNVLPVSIVFQRLKQIKQLKKK